MFAPCVASFCMFCNNVEPNLYEMGGWNYEKIIVKLIKTNIEYPKYFFILMGLAMHLRDRGSNDLILQTTGRQSRVRLKARKNLRALDVHACLRARRNSTVRTVRGSQLLSATPWQAPLPYFMILQRFSIAHHRRFWGLRL